MNPGLFMKKQRIKSDLNGTCRFLLIPNGVAVLAGLNVASYRFVEVLGSWSYAVSSS